MVFYLWRLKFLWGFFAISDAKTPDFQTVKLWILLVVQSKDASAQRHVSPVRLLTALWAEDSITVDDSTGGCTTVCFGSDLASLYWCHLLLRSMVETDQLGQRIQKVSLIEKIQRDRLNFHQSWTQRHDGKTQISQYSQTTSLTNSCIQSLWHFLQTECKKLLMFTSKLPTAALSNRKCKYSSKEQESVNWSQI